jgi:hypothetical protein
MKKIFSTQISKKQASDTGMAAVLIFLLIGVFRQDFDYVKIAIIALIFTMTIPLIYKYFAVIWLGLSHLLGVVISKIVLSLIFFIVVTPVALIRRLLGYDTLKLRQFKNGSESVLHTRDITFTKNDIDKPF